MAFSLQGVGDNRDGRICSSLPKTVIKQFSEISMNVSTACGYNYTLFMFSKKSGGVNQLVFCECEINGGSPIFLDIGNKHPLALYGGFHHSAAISSDGEVIFINNDSVKNSPSAQIKSYSLLKGEKATSVACGSKRVIVLRSSGGVYSSKVESGSSVLKFSRVGELSTYEFFLAVSKEGRVFVCGTSSHDELGLGKRRSSVSEFTEISSALSHSFRNTRR